MSLADTLAPEGIGLAIGQDRLAKQAIEREHAGIPADRDHSDLAALAGGGIYALKMLGDPCMGVKAIYYVEMLCKHGGLLRQIGGRAAANDHYVDLIRPRGDLVCTYNGNAVGSELQGGGIATGKHRHKLHICILCNGTLRAAPQISVSKNTNTNHIKPPSGEIQYYFIIKQAILQSYQFKNIVKTPRFRHSCGNGVSFMPFFVNPPSQS